MLPNIGPGRLRIVIRYAVHVSPLFQRIMFKRLLDINIYIHIDINEFDTKRDRNSTTIRRIFVRGTTSLGIKGAQLKTPLKHLGLSEHYLIEGFKGGP